MTIKDFIKKHTANCRPDSLGVFDDDNQMAYEDGYNSGYEEGYTEGFEKALNVLLMETVPATLSDKIIEAINNL